MPLYEVILRMDGHDETRLHDRPLRVGEQVKLKGVWWRVRGASRSSGPPYARRYVLEREPSPLSRSSS